MLLMHVTKSGHCAYCGSGVRKCVDLTCQQFFHPKHRRHIYHRAGCKMREYRKRKKVKLSA